MVKNAKLSSKCQKCSFFHTLVPEMLKMTSLSPERWKWSFLHRLRSEIIENAEFEHEDVGKSILVEFELENVEIGQKYTF